MRLVFVLATLLGCGVDEIDAPDDCVVVDELHIVHGAIDERVTLSNHAYSNAFGGISTLDISTGTSNVVHIEWKSIADDGDIVDAHGKVTLPSGLDVGNCETGGMPSKFHVVGGGTWRFELRALAMAPYCEGAPVAEPLGGCYRSR